MFSFFFFWKNIVSGSCLNTCGAELSTHWNDLEMQLAKRIFYEQTFGDFKRGNGVKLGAFSPEGARRWLILATKV